MSNQADDGADSGGRQADGQWLTYADAAARLGISPEAVRKRAQRGTLPSDRRDERTYVWIADADRAGVRADAAGIHDHLQVDAGRTRADEPSTTAIAALESEVAYLRQLLDAEVEARRRADLLNAALLERLPKLTGGDAAMDAAQTQNQAPGATKNADVGEDAGTTVASPWGRFLRWLRGSEASR